MQRIHDPTAVAARPPVPALSGTAGFFTNGIPGIQPPTIVPDWWLNMTQEELLAIVAAAGLPVDGSANLLQALRVLFQASLGYVAANLATFAGYVDQNVQWQKMPAVGSGQELIVQSGTGHTGSSGIVYVTYPITFPNKVLAFTPATIGSTGYSYSLVTGGIPTVNSCPVVASNLSNPGTNGGDVSFSWIATGW